MLGNAIYSHCMFYHIGEIFLSYIVDYDILTDDIIGTADIDFLCKWLNTSYVHSKKAITRSSIQVIYLGYGSALSPKWVYNYTCMQCYYYLWI